MTAQPARSAPSAAEAEARSPRYFIDEAWYEKNGRSLEQMIESRLSRSQPGEKQASRRPQKSTAAAMASLAKLEGFVIPDLPILEAVFRLLLVHQNKPLTIEEISDELAERGIGIRDARSVRPETLIRILDHDTYYGIRRHPED